MVEIKFGTGNAAFWIHDSYDYDEQGQFDYVAVARVVREVADKIARGREDGKIMDVNGNCIGTFKVDC